MKKASSFENLKEIGQRIKNLRIKLGLSRAEFAEKFNLKRVSRLNKYENGITEPPMAFFLKLSKDAGVSVDWILTGEGPKDRDKTSESSEQQEEVSPLLKEYRTRFQSGAGLIIITPEEFKDKLKQIESQKEYVPLPLLSEHIITEDFIIIDNRDIEAYIIAPINWLRHGDVYCCVQIRDDSMFPLLEKGFIVAVDCSVTDAHHLKGKIIAAHDKSSGHRITIKKLWLTDTHYILQPFNMIDYQPIKIPIEEKNIIIGEVAWWWVQPKH